MHVSLAGDVIHNVSYVLLSSAADEIFLWRCVLQKQKHKMLLSWGHSEEILSIVSASGSSQHWPLGRYPWAGRPVGGCCGTVLLGDTWQPPGLYRCDWLHGQRVRFLHLQINTRNFVWHLWLSCECHSSHVITNLMSPAANRVKMTVCFQNNSPVPVCSWRLGRPDPFPAQTQTRH